ncbi:MAG: ATP-dependent DNA helicase [Patescibacteria group bacterium]
MIKTLSEDQKKAIKTLYLWYKAANKPPYITLGGYAGTGKTTTISIFRKAIYKDNKEVKVAFCSFTGKGAVVLKNKLKEAGTIYSKDFVGTIHSLIYSPIISKGGEIMGWETKDELKYDLIVIDEASMVDSQIWNDLLYYKIPIIAVGDHGQLPPINGNFNLMEKPQLKLETIHRQAEENPIIKLSVLARNEGLIPLGEYGKNVKKLTNAQFEGRELVDELLRGYNKDMLILCGYNSTRIKINNYIRGALEYETSEPQFNDRVICLKNNRKQNIYNGMLGNIVQIYKEDPDWYYAEIELDEEGQYYKGLISVDQFGASETLNFKEDRKKSRKGDLFDFGYALTVHKAQGSEANRVVVFEERFAKMDDDTWRKWLYTAVTRAAKELYVVGNEVIEE